MHPRLGKKIYMDKYTGPVRDDDSIFVSVASYRDSECSNTLRDLFEKASRPERVFVGLVEQNKHFDKQCEVDSKYSNNVRRIRLRYNQARGPCYARYLASCLYQGETFFFQIDSHTKFDHNWDTDLIAMIREMPSNAVISNYPVSWSERGTPKVPQFPTVRRFGPYYAFNPVYSDMNTKHEQHLGSSGCMLFMHGRALVQVPFDPELDWVFDGEEFLYSARLYTYGYDFYRPTKNVVYHFFGREGCPKFWDDLRSFRSKQDITKPVHDRMLNPPTQYFGNERTFQSYMDKLEKHVNDK
jgi:[Skp1-protein]-hydroxyproline N-acetylglucosaminyltransferase